MYFIGGIKQAARPGMLLLLLRWSATLYGEGDHLALLSGDIRMFIIPALLLLRCRGFVWL